MRNLQASFNPEASRIIESQSRDTEAGVTKEHESSAGDNEEEDEINEEAPTAFEEDIESQGGESVSLAQQVLQISNLMIELSAVTKNDANLDASQYIEPKTYEEAWFHPDPVQCRKWREAIAKEFSDMEKRKVWTKILRRDMPIGRRCVKSKWVLKIKRDGRFRARIVACGYSQIPGVDYTDNYAPVVNDVTFRMMLLLWIQGRLSAKIVDVETAFLYGALVEQIFMECPKGMQGATTDHVVSLRQCIYGLVQAARQYYKHIVAILKKIGFIGGDVDPCLFTKKSKLGMCYVAIYVDDNLIVGHPKAVEDAIQQLKEHKLILKVEDTLKDYLSCEIFRSDEEKSAWLGQPHLIANLEQTFGDEVKSLRSTLTPGTPGLNQVREKEESLIVPADKQKRYRSGVGMLLYLVKHSRPDIANPVRELSKVLDGTSTAAYREMLRCIKFVLDTRTLGLRLWPSGERNDPWDIICFTDSDYASDPVSRKSVSGYIIYVKGVPVCWRSKSQRCVTLSSCEAEWVALSEAVKDIIFLVRVCESMMLPVSLPVTVRVDNVGAIFLSENVTTSNNTKHVDIRSKFVWEYRENGTIKIIFVRSENNDSDIMTKNLVGTLYAKHSQKLVTRK